MTSRRTHGANAWETNLNGGIDTSATTIALDSTTGLTAPGYLCIDPDIPASREYIKYATINGSSLEGCTRNAQSGGQLAAHATGAVVRMSYTAGHLDDTFSDIEDLISDLDTHEAAANPHSGSASSADLATTDSNVATNASNIASNVTNIATNAADIAADAADLVTHEAGRLHPEATTGARGMLSPADKTKLDTYPSTFPTDIEDAYRKTRVNLQASTLLTVGGVTVEEFVNVAVPSDWVTYEVVLRAGGVVSTSNNNDGADIQFRADLAGTDPTPTDILVGMVNEAVETGRTGKGGFSLIGRSSTIARADIADVTARLEAKETSGSTGSVYLFDVSFEMEILRRS